MKTKNVFLSLISTLFLMVYPTIGMEFKPDTGVKYNLKSVSSSGYLDGRSKVGVEALVTDRDPYGDQFLQWKIRMVDGNYTLKSVSSGGYLDGRSKVGVEALVTNREPAGDQFLQWDIKKGR